MGLGAEQTALNVEVGTHNEDQPLVVLHEITAGDLCDRRQTR